MNTIFGLFRSKQPRGFAEVDFCDSATTLLEEEQCDLDGPQNLDTTDTPIPRPVYPWSSPCVPLAGEEATQQTRLYTVPHA
jgi:hypothetical protein